MKGCTFLGRILSDISNFKKKINILETLWLTWVYVYPSGLGIHIQSEKKYFYSRSLLYKCNGLGTILMLRQNRKNQELLPPLPTSGEREKRQRCQVEIWTIYWKKQWRKKKNSSNNNSNNTKSKNIPREGDIHTKKYSMSHQLDPVPLGPWDKEKNGPLCGHCQLFFRVQKISFMEVRIPYFCLPAMMCMI